MSRHIRRSLVGMAGLTAGVVMFAGAPEAVKRSFAAGERVATDRNGDPLPAGAVVRLGSQRLRVAATIVSIAWSPDGKLFATGESDRTLRSAFVTVWDATTGQAVKRLKAARSSQITRLRFSADGKRLTGSGLYGTVEWEFPSGKSLSSKLVAGLGSPDGKTSIKSGRDRRQLRVFDAATGRQLATIQVEGQRNGFMTYAYSPDGTSLATGTYDGQLHLWDVRTGKPRFQFLIPKSMVGKVAFTPDGKILAAAGYIRGIHLFDTANGKLLRTIAAHSGTQPINTIAFSQDGKWIASAGRDDNAVEIHGVRDGKRQRTIPTGIDDVKHLAFSPDGSKIVVASGDRSFSGNQRLGVWSVATGKELLVKPGHVGRVYQVVFSPEGAVIATAGQEGTVRLWDATSGRQIARFSALRSQKLAFSPDGWLLGAVEPSGNYKIWEVSTAEEVLSRTDERSYDGVSSALSPELGQLAVGTRSGTINLFHTATGKLVRKIALPNRAAEVASVEFSPDGKLLAAAQSSRFLPGGGKAEITVWDATTGKSVRSLSNPNVAAGRRRRGFFRLQWSPDGQTLAAAGQDGQLYLWDTGGVGMPLKIPMDSDSAYAFAPDGRSLVIAPGARRRRFSSRLRKGPTSIRILEITTGKDYATLPDTEQPVTAIALSPRGDRLATALQDVNNVVVWNISPPTVSSPSDASLRLAWETLKETDARAAYRAIWTMVAGKDRSLKLIQGGFHSKKKPVPVARIRQLVAKLGHDKYKVRHEASKELRQIGGGAVPELKAALAKSRVPEVRQRIQVLLKRLTGSLQRLSGEPLRRIRAVQVLERINSKKSRQFLQNVAEGPPEARESIDAKAALKRIDNLRRGR